MDTTLRILCVDDEENVLRALKRLFLDNEYEVLSAASGTDGLAILRSTAPVQVILSDYRMPGMNGVEFLREVCAHWPHTVRIVLSGYADTSSVVSAINEGQIYKFIPKPWNDDELKVTIANAFERYALHQQNLHLAQELKKRNEELLSLNMILKERITDKVGDLEAKNRKLMHNRAALQFLPLPVIALNRDGSWIRYFNEKARELFACAAYENAPLKRAEAFSAQVNAVLDKILFSGSGSGSVAINGRSMKALGAWTTYPNTEKNAVIVFQDNDSTGQEQEQFACPAATKSE